ncbi:hypothetical protein CVT26_008690 [Gymnopilus dilepis]|uniref:(2E,6E)-farnesyl diphosphate synthase n=1 Tax=Gymnopilus dilepis TaxID=231916 RepID=A0A409W9R6_9AGAR|nr:hypothetical protein CVT26_008690 [Gymnopilus dilepis]
MLSRLTARHSSLSQFTTVSNCATHPQHDGNVRIIHGARRKLTGSRLKPKPSTEVLRSPTALSHENRFAEGRKNEYGSSYVELTYVRNSDCAQDRPVKSLQDVKDDMARSASLTLREVSNLYPPLLEDAEHAANTLQLNPKFDGTTHDIPSRYLEDLPLDTLHRHFFAPVRHLVNGRAKVWRPYLFSLSLQALGADPDMFRPLMGGIELIHTGSLIVDDIQDGTSIRRGVPAVHTQWGIPTAINAGAAAYFAFHTAVQSIPGLTPEKMLGLMHIYFEMMRLGHIGQALDIAGQQRSLLSDIVAGRAGPDALEKSILAIHRLKTGVFSSHVAKMAALLANASAAQTQALADHWECVGIAHQILDDVEDIRRALPSQENQEQDDRARAVKRHSSDIQAGKINIPLARAGSLMPLSEAQWVWETVLNRPEDGTAIQRVFDLLESYEVIDGCISDARAMVRESWRHLDYYLPDSQAKDDLYALSWYMAEYKHV